MTYQRSFTFYAVLMFVAVQFVIDKIAYETLWGYYGVIDLVLVSLGVSGLVSAGLCWVYLKLDDMSESDLAYRFAVLSFVEIICTAIVMVQYNYDMLGEWNQVAISLIFIKFALLIKDSGFGDVIRMLSEHFRHFADRALRLYVYCHCSAALLQTGRKI